MLQFNKPLVSVAGGVDKKLGLVEISSPAEMIKSFFGFLRRQFPIILIFFLIGIGLGATYILTTPPMFTALTLDDHRRPEILNVPKARGTRQQLD